MEKRLLKVLKGLAELKDLTLGDLLEGIVLHAFEGKAPFSPADPEGDRKTAQCLRTHAQGGRQPSTQGASLMKSTLAIFALTMLAGVVALTKADAQEPAANPRLTHTRTEFHFTVDASFEQTAPLFGAHEERKWSPDWNPQFIYPNPAQDQAGMVFRVMHGQHSSTWVNTAFDLAARTYPVRLCAE